MIPLLLAGLTAAGGELISSAPTIAGSAFDKEQKRRLEALKLQEQMNALGLSDQERQVLESRLRARSRQAQVRADAERNRLLAGGVGSSQAASALQQDVLADEARARQEIQVQQAVEERDLAEKEKDEAELRALEAAVGERAQQRAQALANVAASGLEAGVTTAAQTQLMQGPREPSSSSLNKLMQRYGLSVEAARGLLELATEHPELTSYLDKLGE